MNLGLVRKEMGLDLEELIRSVHVEHETQQAEGHRVLVSTFTELTHGTLQGSQNLDHGSAGGRETDNKHLPPALRGRLGKARGEK